MKRRGDRDPHRATDVSPAPLGAGSVEAAQSSSQCSCRRSSPVPRGAASIEATRIRSSSMTSVRVTGAARHPASFEAVCGSSKTLTLSHHRRRETSAPLKPDRLNLARQHRGGLRRCEALAPLKPGHRCDGQLIKQVCHRRLRALAARHRSSSRHPRRQAPGPLKRRRREELNQPLLVTERLRAPASLKRGRRDTPPTCRSRLSPAPQGAGSVEARARGRTGPNARSSPAPQGAGSVEACAARRCHRRSARVTGAVRRRLR